MRPDKIFLFILLLGNFYFAAAQKFHNLNFEQQCDSSKTGFCYWDLSWGNQQNIRPDTIGKHPCLLIQGKSLNTVSFVEQSSRVSTFHEPVIITVSAAISTENIEGKGAGLNVNIYDQNDQLLAFKDMGGFYSIDWLTGNHFWKRLSISLVCPEGTAKIRIGAILYGKGKAWFRNYAVKITPISDRKPSTLASKYISAACDIIKKNSLVRDSFNVEPAKAIALKIAGNAQTYEDCYLAITYLLESLRQYGDYHSFFMKAAEVRNWKTKGSSVSKIEYPSYKIVEDCGYIKVPAFHGGNEQIMLAYADSLQTSIKKLDASAIKGWVIDLRENTGGNMEPMIAGLGPLFSSEKLGSLVDVNKKSIAWYYKNGKYYGDDFDGWKVSDPVSLKSKLPIAVLISNKVGSSGEIVVISFIGNERTKLFGQPTMGLTTGNGSFDLPDGSKMFLASTIMADRNGKQYTGSIQPDVTIETLPNDKTDKVLSAAIEWIRSQQ